MHDDEAVRVRIGQVVQPTGQPRRDRTVILPIGCRTQQHGVAVNDIAMRGSDIGIIFAAPAAHADLHQPVVVTCRVPVEVQMLGDDGQSLQGAARTRSVQFDIGSVPQ